MDELPEIDLEAHEAEIGDMPHDDAVTAWSNWHAKPSPEKMAVALRSVRPIVDKSVSRFPRYNASILGGEAKRLAIAAIKTYDPAQGTKLSTHVYNHLRPLGRFAADVGTAAPKSRLDKTRTAEYLGAVRDLTELNNREPSDDDLRDYLGVDSKMLFKMRQSSVAETAESQLEYLPSQSEDPRMQLWTDYVYHDLDPMGKLIMDHKLGRNGRAQLSTEEVAAKLKLNPDYVNRRAGVIAKKILDGVSGSSSTPR